MPDTDWKQRYFDVLAEHEQAEAAWKAREEMLGFAVNRLSLLGQGLDARLDPHLESLRAGLRRGDSTERLRAEAGRLADLLDELRRLGHAGRDDELLPAEEAAGTMASDSAALDADGEIAFEEDAILPDGSRRRVHKTKTPVPLDNGERMLVVALVDITERHVAQIALESGKNFLDAVLNTLPMPLTVKDREHRFVLVNDAAASLIGRDKTAVLGRTDRDFFPPAQADTIWAEDEIALTSGQRVATEAHLTLYDGNHWLLKTKQAIRTEGGTVNLISASLDITDRKNAEEEVRQHRARLELLNDAASALSSGVGVAEVEGLAIAGLSRLLPGLPAALCIRDSNGKVTIRRAMLDRHPTNLVDWRAEWVAPRAYADSLSDGHMVAVNDAAADPLTFEVGVGLDFAVATVGTSGAISSSTLQKPVVVFVYGQQGLFAGVNVAGQKITERASR